LEASAACRESNVIRVEIGGQYSPLPSSTISETGFPLTPFGKVLFRRAAKSGHLTFFGFGFTRTGGLIVFIST
jgi:hypothetical protein